MPESAEVSTSPCVLSFVLHRNHPGHVAIDGFGVRSGSFGCTDLRDHPRAVRPWTLMLALSNALREYRPTVVVLGTPKMPDRMSREYRRRALCLLREAQVPVVVESVREGRKLLLERLRSQRRQELAHVLVETFFEELRPFLTKRTAAKESDYVLMCYWSPAWYAVALAVHVLAQRHPRIAFALARCDAGQLATVIAAAERHLHPLITKLYEPVIPHST